MLKSIYVKLMVVLTVVLLAGRPSILSAGHDMHSHGYQHSPTASGAAANPLVEEMTILDSAFREVVSAVAMGDGERVRKALHAMQGTMEKTHEGVHEGTVKIPNNADREKEFVQMDKEFHQDIGRLAEAGMKNDQKTMLDLTKKLLDGCVNCHRNFRK